MPPLHCHACGTATEIDEPVPRDSECGSCRRDLRCCKNCRHYDTHYNNACRETMADPVEDKERRNFCEYFSFDAQPRKRAGAEANRAAEARKKLDALFAKPSQPQGDDPEDA